MKNRPSCIPGETKIPARFAVGVGIAAGWAFLIGLFLGIGR